jgi:hypothetical protein
MIAWLRHLLGWTVSTFKSREDLVLENLGPFVNNCWRSTLNDLADG